MFGGRGTGKQPQTKSKSSEPKTVVPSRILSTGFGSVSSLRDYIMSTAADIAPLNVDLTADDGDDDTYVMPPIGGKRPRAPPKAKTKAPTEKKKKTPTKKKPKKDDAGESASPKAPPKPRARARAKPKTKAGGGGAAAAASESGDAPKRKPRAKAAPKERPMCPKTTPGRFYIVANDSAGNSVTPMGRHVHRLHRGRPPREDTVHYKLGFHVPIDIAPPPLSASPGRMTPTQDALQMREEHLLISVYYAEETVAPGMADFQFMLNLPVADILNVPPIPCRLGDSAERDPLAERFVGGQHTGDTDEITGIVNPGDDSTVEWFRELPTCILKFANGPECTRITDLYISMQNVQIDPDHDYDQPIWIPVVNNLAEWVAKEYTSVAARPIDDFVRRVILPVPVVGDDVPVEERKKRQVDRANERRLRKQAKQARESTRSGNTPEHSSDTDMSDEYDDSDEEEESGGDARERRRHRPDPPPVEESSSPAQPAELVAIPMGGYIPLPFVHPDPDKALEQLGHRIYMTPQRGALWKAMKEQKTPWTPKIFGGTSYSKIRNLYGDNGVSDPNFMPSSRMRRGTWQEASMVCDLMDIRPWLVLAETGPWKHPELPDQFQSNPDLIAWDPMVSLDDVPPWVMSEWVPWAASMGKRVADLDISRGVIEFKIGDSSRYHGHNDQTLSSMHCAQGLWCLLQKKHLPAMCTGKKPWKCQGRECDAVKCPFRQCPNKKCPGGSDAPGSRAPSRCPHERCPGKTTIYIWRDWWRPDRAADLLELVSNPEVQKAPQGYVPELLKTPLAERLAATEKRTNGWHNWWEKDTIPIGDRQAVAYGTVCEESGHVLGERSTAFMESQKQYYVKWEDIAPGLFDAVDESQTMLVNKIMADKDGLTDADGA